MQLIQLAWRQGHLPLLVIVCILAVPLPFTSILTTWGTWSQRESVVITQPDRQFDHSPVVNGAAILGNVSDDVASPSHAQLLDRSGPRLLPRAAAAEGSAGQCTASNSLPDAAAAAAAAVKDAGSAPGTDQEEQELPEELQGEQQQPEQQQDVQQQDLPAQEGLEGVAADAAIAAELVAAAADLPAQASDLQEPLADCSAGGVDCSSMGADATAELQGAAAATGSSMLADLPLQQDSSGAAPVLGLQEQHVQQQQLLLEGLGPSGADVAGASLMLGVPLTPQMLAGAYTRLGHVHTAAYLFCLVLTALLMRALITAVTARLSKKRQQLSGLPRSVQRNPEALDAFFALRQLYYQQQAWWRLVGVSGIAVSQAMQSKQQAHSIAGRLQGSARFARQLLHWQEQRLLAKQVAAVAKREQQLQHEHQQQLEAKAAAHAEQVQGLQEQIQQQRERHTRQADSVRKLRFERAQLRAQLAESQAALDTAKEVNVRQQADLSSMQRLLSEERQAKAVAQQDLGQLREQAASDRTRQEILLSRVEEAEKRQQALSAECADLKQQLADANHSIHLLTGQAQQKDDSLAAKDASLQQLSIEKQALLQDKQQLLTQLSTAQQDLFTERQQVAVLQEKQQQTQHRVQELQQQLEEQAAAAATQEENIEQLIEEYQQERAKLAEAQVKLQEASHDSERAKERCGALEQQLEEQGQDAEALLQRCMDQQQQLEQLQAKVDSQKSALHQAQQALSEHMDGNEEKERLNTVLSQENDKLQSRVLVLEEHNKQLEKEIEELGDLLTQLTAEQEELKQQHMTMHTKAAALQAEQDSSLQQALAKNAEQQDKLSTAEAAVSRLTRDCDELSKKLYWAELARDQTKAAKELAAEDMIKSREALREEKLRKQQTPSSTPGARGAAAAAAGGSGAELSSSRLWHSNSQTAKKWGPVQTAYLHQHYMDAHGQVRRAGSPTRSSSTAGSTPGTPRSVACASGAGDSTSTTPRCRSQQNTPQQEGSSTPTAASLAAPAEAGSPGVAALTKQLQRLGSGELPSPAASSSPRPGRLNGQNHSSSSSSSTQQSRLAAEAAAVVAAGGHLRRLSSGGSGTGSRLQATSSQQQQEEEAKAGGLQRSRSSGIAAGNSSESPRQQDAGSTAAAAAGSPSASPSPGHARAAAAEGLRRNFHDTSAVAVALADAFAAAGIEEHAGAATVGEATATSPAAAVAGEASQPAAAVTSDSSGPGIRCPSPSAPTAAQDSSAHPQQQQQPREHQQQEAASPAPSAASASGAAGTPTSHAGGTSPGLCSTGNSTRSRIVFDASAAAAADLRPLALSPVQQSCDLLPTGGLTEAAGAAGSRPWGPSFSSRLEAAAAEEDAEQAAAAAAAGAAAAAESFIEAVIDAAGEGCIATQPSCGGSVVSAPNTPVASAAGGVAAAGAALSLEAPSEELFLTPLPVAPSSGSSDTPASTSGAAAALKGCQGPGAVEGAVTDKGGNSSSGGVGGGGADVEPSTPYFTPQPAPAASQALEEGLGAAAAAAASAACDGEAGVITSPTAGAAKAAIANAATAAAEVDAAAAGSPAARSHNNNDSINARLRPQLLFVSSSAPLRCVPNLVDDSDAVLMGSLSETDFAALGMGSSTAESQLQQLTLPAAAGTATQPTKPAGDAVQQVALSAQTQVQVQPAAASAAGSLRGSTGSGSTGGSSDGLCWAAAAAAADEDVANGSQATSSSRQGPLVPRLPLFQLNAAAGSLAAGAAAGAVAAAGSALGGDDGALVASASGSSSDGDDDDAGMCCDNDDVDADGDGLDGICDEEVPLDAAAPPGKMLLLGKVSPSPRAAAGAAAAAGGVLAMHSPRYQDQRATPSPRYPSQQQQALLPRPRSVGSLAPKVAVEHRASTPQPDAAVAAGEPTASLAALAAAAGAARQRNTTADDRQGSGRDSGTPQDLHSVLPAQPAVMRTSPPSAAAAAGAVRASRRSSRLSAEQPSSSSSCSSIKSLVAHSHQQHQEQQALRRAGSSGSPGGSSSSGKNPTRSSALGSPQRQSGCLDQHGLAKALAMKQQQQGRLWRSSASSSSGSSNAGSRVGTAAAAAAAVCGSAGGVPEQGSMAALLLNSTGSVGSDTGVALRAAGRDTRQSRDSILSGSHSVRNSSSSSTPGGHKSLQGQQQQWPLSVPSLGGGGGPGSSASSTSSPARSSLGLSSSRTPPRQGIRPMQSASVGRPGGVSYGGQLQTEPPQREAIMWKSFDDVVVSYARGRGAGSSTHSSPGVRGPPGSVGSSVTALPPVFLSPPPARVAGGWASPPAAAAVTAAAGGTPSATAGPAASPPAAAAEALTPAAACRSHCGAGGTEVLSPPVVLPVAEGVCEGMREACESPDSIISGASADSACEAAGDEDRGQADAWVVKENPVFFEY